MLAVGAGGGDGGVGLAKPVIRYSCVTVKCSMVQHGAPSVCHNKTKAAQEGGADPVLADMTRGNTY